jgi:hypothetical protein
MSEQDVPAPNPNDLELKKKTESFNIFFEQNKNLFIQWQKQHPGLTFPLLYDPGLDKWYWLNRTQRKLRNWKPKQVSIKAKPTEDLESA